MPALSGKRVNRRGKLSALYQTLKHAFASIPRRTPILFKDTALSLKDWRPICCPETSATASLRYVIPKRTKTSFISRRKPEIAHIYILFIDYSVPPCIYLINIFHSRGLCRIIQETPLLWKVFSLLKFNSQFVKNVQWSC